MRRVSLLLFIGSIALGLIASPSPILSQGIDNHDHDPLLADHSLCGTAVIIDLMSRRDHLTEKEEAQLQSLLADRPVMERTYVSPSGRFLVHYDVTGNNAPMLVDRNANGVPDYIDSVAYYVDYAYEVEIGECRFAPPPGDDTGNGAGGPDGRIDVYVQALSRQFYGWAQPETPIGSNPTRYTGYLVIDNDYAGYPTPGIAGLRVTTAHEFHHIVQFGYKAYTGQAVMFESTSTWFEYRVHPDLNDYRNYLVHYLRTPQRYAYSGNTDSVNGYAQMLYLQSLVQQAGKDIILSIWNEFQSKPMFDAIDAALLKSNSDINLQSSWCTFAFWSYFTGVNASDTAFFPMARSLPTLQPAIVRTLDAESETGIIDKLLPFSFGLYKLLYNRPGAETPDTIDFLVSNSRPDVGSGGLNYESDAEAFTLDISTSPRNGYIPISIESDSIFYKFTPAHEHFCLETIVNGSRGYTLAVRPSPQPFVNDGVNRIMFAVNKDEGSVTSLRLQIYTTAMSLAADITRTGLEAHENLRGVAWDGVMNDGSLAPSGVYIYVLSVNDDEPTVGKFAVVRR